MTNQTKGKLVSRIMALLFMGAAIVGSVAMLSSGERSLFADAGKQAPQTAMSR